MFTGIVLVLGVLVENSETGLPFFLTFMFTVSPGCQKYSFSWMPEIFLPLKPIHVVEAYLDASFDIS